MRYKKFRAQLKKLLRRYATAEKNNSTVFMREQESHENTCRKTSATYIILINIQQLYDQV
jgi:hypothetical protein